MEHWNELLARERQNECRWYWLSFMGDDGFLGGCFVLAPGFCTAVDLAWERGLNPGGEVMGVPVDKVPPLELQNRLLGKDDLAANGGWARV